MKIECSIEKLKGAVIQADRVTGKNLTLPILSSLLLIASGKTLKIRATNLSLGIEVEIPAKIEKEGIVAIRGDVMNGFLGSLNINDMIYLELQGDILSVKTKKSRVSVKTYPSDDFPTIPAVDGEKIIIPTKKFIDGVRNVFYSAAVSDIKPEISSIYICAEDQELVFVATDSFRLAEKRVKLKDAANINTLLIPYKNVVEMIKIFDATDGDLILTTSKNQISLSHGGIYVTSRIVDGLYPDYKQIIPKAFTTEAVVLKQDLIGSLKVANIFSDTFNQIGFVIDPKSKKFELNAKNNDIGENSTDLDAALSGEEVSVNFNHKYLVDCFQSISQDSVSISLNGANKPAIIRGVSDMSFRYLIMPMNR